MIYIDDVRPENAESYQVILSHYKSYFLSVPLDFGYSLFSILKEEINQSPKGNKWSAIPVALLCMLVIVSDG